MPESEFYPRDWDGRPIPRPLVDDLAEVLSSTVVGWEQILGHDLSTAPEVVRVLARYREYKKGRVG
jgi:hypothetical protein